MILKIRDNLSFKELKDMHAVWNLKLQQIELSF